MLPAKSVPPCAVDDHVVPKCKGKGMAPLQAGEMLTDEQNMEPSLEPPPPGTGGPPLEDPPPLEEVLAQVRSQCT